MKTPTKPSQKSKQNDFAPHFQAMIQDMREIMQKVDAFQLQFRLAWKRNQSTPIRKGTNEHRRT